MASCGPSSGLHLLFRCAHQTPFRNFDAPDGLEPSAEVHPFQGGVHQCAEPLHAWTGDRRGDSVIPLFSGYLSTVIDERPSSR